jgi:cell division protein ZapA
MSCSGACADWRRRSITLKKTRDNALSKVEKTDHDLAAALTEVTGKIEQIAGKLSGRA